MKKDILFGTLSDSDLDCTPDSNTWSTAGSLLAMDDSQKDISYLSDFCKILSTNTSLEETAVVDVPLLEEYMLTASNLCRDVEDSVSGRIVMHIMVPKPPPPPLM